MGYYFIAIGGSGAKVMESLTHLGVAGLLPNKVRQEKLYVMAIDPDIGNGNLKRSSAALNHYGSFQHLEIGTETPLFKTEVEMASPFVWNPTEHDKRLDDVMSYQSYKNTPLGHLYEVLYTRDERETVLNEGFRGRPAIGAAVMARKVGMDEREEWIGAHSQPWGRFIESVRNDVRNGQMAKIFLVGSVFGGTGAAGLPTVAKLLRHIFREYQENVLLGGGLVLPYFSFSPSTADQTRGQLFASSENFLTNTKAALKYYAVKSAKDKLFDSMYFVGDNVLSPVKNFSVGAATQNNDAHIVDFYMALAAIDFYASRKESVKKCSYISRNEENVFQWSDFPAFAMEDGGEVSIRERFAHFTRFIFSYVHLIRPVLHGLGSGEITDVYKYPWFVDYLSGVNVDAAEIKDFDSYTDHFLRWLGQLEASEANREVRLIRQDSFNVEPLAINPSRFSTCAHDEDSKISMHELWYRLSEHPGHDAESAKGFGRFVRALYDCCEMSEEDKR